MKNNYNPYTVPELFFEETRLKVTVRYWNRMRVVMCSIAAAAVVALVFTVPSVISKSADRNAVEQKSPVNNLAQMYEYDIFLQVNFK